MISEDSVVVVSYWTPRTHIPSGLDAHVWYRVTTLALDPDSEDGFAETPLVQTKPFTKHEVESLDYIWKEAVRRTQWILQQGGERVKLFVRKVCGMPCDCLRDPRTLEFGKQPQNQCPRCFGTSYVGGYEGPYDIIIAPDDAERRVSQAMQGRRLEHTYEVFMGPSPLVSQRDFIVKQSNERYSVGPVRRPSNRGNLLQQHFNIAVLDEGDIRYRVPIDGTDQYTSPETRTGDVLMPRTPVTGEPSYDEQEGWSTETYKEGPDETTPMVTEKAGHPDNVEPRGRTRVWENQNL